MYAVLPYALATGVVEIPYLIIQSLIFTPIVYFMIGFKLEAEAFFLFFIVFMQSISLYTFMGQLFAYLTPSQPIAFMLGGLNHLLWNIFNGFLVPIPLMAAGWKWLNYISATTYVIYALGVSQLGDLTQKLVAPGTGAPLRHPRMLTRKRHLVAAPFKPTHKLVGACAACNIVCLLQAELWVTRRASRCITTCRIACDSCRVPRLLAGQHAGVPRGARLARRLLWLQLQLPLVVRAHPDGLHHHLPRRRHAGAEAGEPPDALGGATALGAACRCAVTVCARWRVCVAIRPRQRRERCSGEV